MNTPKKRGRPPVQGDTCANGCDALRHANKDGSRSHLCYTCLRAAMTQRMRDRRHAARMAGEALEVEQAEAQKRAEQAAMREPIALKSDAPYAWRHRSRLWDALERAGQ